jgi:hypothetical protein
MLKMVAGGLGLLLQPIDNGLQCGAPVMVGLTTAQQVEVGTIEDKDVGHKVLATRRAECKKWR